MDYKNVEYDFIERTLSILSQYGNNCYFAPPLDEKFSVTLLINCLVGLLIFPFENRKKHANNPSQINFFDNDSIQIKELDSSWGIGGFTITCIKDFNNNEVENKNEVPLKLLIYRLRNSIAHSRWEQATDTEDSSLFYDGTKLEPKQGLGLLFGVKEDNPNKSQISSLLFRDVNPYNNEEIRFQANVNVNSLEKFITKFASEVLKSIKLD